MNHLDFGPANLAPTVLPPRQLARELTDVRAWPVSGSAEVGYTLLNQHRYGEEPAIVSVGGFMSSLTSADRAWEGVQLAALDRPVLMLDLPGHGLSAKNSARQIIDLCFRRDGSSQATPLTDAMLQILGEDPVDLFGNSHGGLMTLHMGAQAPDGTVRSIFNIDTPAMQQQATLRLQAGYLVKDGMRGRKTYLEALSGSEHEANLEAFKKFFDSKTVPDTRSFARNNMGLMLLNLVSSVNASPGAFLPLWQIMNNTSTHVRLITSEKGSVSAPQAIQSYIESLPEAQQHRISQEVITDEDHNVGIVHLMPRAVAWARDFYNKQAA